MTPYLLCGAFGLIALLVEMRRRRLLAELAREAVALPSMRDRTAVTGLAERARRYAGATSSIIATVHRGRVVWRDLANVAVRHIREREQRAGRGPFKSKTPIWHETFLDDGTFTLIVPLISRGRTIGYWLPSFASANAPVDIIASLAPQLAAALDEPARRPSAIATVRRAHVDHEDLARLCEAMPYGVFVMTVWGEVRYANTAMKLAMSSVGVDERDPVMLLRALTRHHDSLGQLRTFVQSQAPLCVEGERGRVALSWLGGGDERLVVGWLLPEDRIESAAILSSMSITTIAPAVGPTGTLRFFAVAA